MRLQRVRDNQVVPTISPHEIGKICDFYSGFLIVLGRICVWSHLCFVATKGLVFLLSTDIFWKSLSLGSPLRFCHWYFVLDCRKNLCWIFAYKPIYLNFFRFSGVSCASPISIPPTGSRLDQRREATGKVR
jgi:hypothetical protein